MGVFIGFTFFDSCVGVVSRIRDQERLIGIHLVLFTKETNELMRPSDVTTVVKETLRRLHYDPSTTIVIGNIADWKGLVQQGIDPKLSPWRRIRELTPTPPEIHDHGQGVYGARLIRGEIRTTFRRR